MGKGKDRTEWGCGLKEQERLEARSQLADCNRARERLGDLYQDRIGWKKYDVSEIMGIF